jgi:two-component sensor histidine kinase
VTPLETSQLRLAADAMTLAASASVCIGFLWVLFRIRSRIGSRLRPMALMCVFIVALAGSQILRYAAGLYPAHLAVNVLATLVAAAALTMALAIWAFIPGLARQPTHNELLAANADLRAERDARIAVVHELRRTRDELEDRVEERTRALDLTRRRFEIALQGTGIVVTHQDRNLRYTWMYNPPPPLRGEDVVGRLPSDVLPDTLAAKQESVKRRVIESGEAARFEAVYPTPDGPIWYEGRVEPLLVDGRLEGVMTVSIDVTRHMLHERQMREVMRELTHRSKNLLAVVLGMARQSSADATDMRLFIDGFDARVQALSRAHEMLVDGNWRGVPLRVVLEREFTSLAGRLHAVGIEGPDILLSPETAQNFALAINELANDMRSAAPNATMNLDVSWRIDDGVAYFDWRRAGGDCQSKFDGFGANLLKRVLPRQIGGQARLTHAPDACTYALEGRAALLAPVGRRSLLDKEGGPDRNSVS